MIDPYDNYNNSNNGSSNSSNNNNNNDSDGGGCNVIEKMTNVIKIFKIVLQGIQGEYKKIVLLAHSYKNGNININANNVNASNVITQPKNIAQTSQNYTINSYSSNNSSLNIT